jgi:hypothetical protein
MRAKELLEAELPTGIETHLKKLGYTKLGRGVDQTVWLEPGTGLVLKIFGSDRSSGPTMLTHSQKMFIKFANYCMANPNNEFLPKFFGHKKFTFNGHNFLQIKCERLFEINQGAGRIIANGLYDMADLNKMRKPLAYYLKAGFQDIHPGFKETITYLGKNGVTKLWNTITELRKIAAKGGFFLDLHPGNFMLGSDGHIVISDPFFNGY